MGKGFRFLSQRTEPVPKLHLPGRKAYLWGTPCAPHLLALPQHPTATLLPNLSPHSRNVLGTESLTSPYCSFHFQIKTNSSLKKTNLTQRHTVKNYQPNQSTLQYEKAHPSPPRDACSSKKQHSKPKSIFSNIFSTGEKGKASDCEGRIIQRGQPPFHVGSTKGALAHSSKLLSFQIHRLWKERRERFSSFLLSPSSTTLQLVKLTYQVEKVTQKFLAHNTSRVTLNTVTTRKGTLPWLQPPFLHANHL